MRKNSLTTKFAELRRLWRFSAIMYWWWLRNSFRLFSICLFTLCSYALKGRWGVRSNPIRLLETEFMHQKICLGTPIANLHWGSALIIYTVRDWKLRIWCIFQFNPFFIYFAVEYVRKQLTKSGRTWPWTTRFMEQLYVRNREWVKCCW